MIQASIHYGWNSLIHKHRFTTSINPQRFVPVEPNILIPSKHQPTATSSQKSSLCLCWFVPVWMCLIFGWFGGVSMVDFVVCSWLILWCWVCVDGVSMLILQCWVSWCVHVCWCVCVYERRKKMMRERRCLSWFCRWRKERKKERNVKLIKY